MNGKKVKGLRREAESLTKGYPNVEYVTNSVDKKMRMKGGGTTLVRRDTGVLDPSCTRAV